MALPETPTPIEKFVQLIPMRYPLAVLAWVIILDPVGFGIANYVQSGAVFQFPNPWNAFFGVLLNFYLFYIVRYLRVRVVTGEPQIAPIMAGGDAAYHSVFGRVSSTRSIIYLAVFLEALTLLATPHPALLLVEFYNLITQVILIVAFATLIWEYSAASWGLHKLGESQLNLKSFLEGRFLGARSVGNLGLSLTIAYLGGLLLFFLDSVTFLPVFANPGFESFFLILLGLGVVMFFLPLNSVHRKMQAEKVGTPSSFGPQTRSSQRG